MQNNSDVELQQTGPVGPLKTANIIVETTIDHVQSRLGQVFCVVRTERVTHIFSVRKVCHVECEK